MTFCPLGRNHFIFQNINRPVKIMGENRVSIG